MTQTTLTGSCLCGAVKYRATGEATRFVHCHCSRCRKSTGTGHASNLFLQPGTNAVIVPTGSLDVEAPMLPQARIFYGSRTAWSCEAGTLPTFTDYPPQT